MKVRALLLATTLCLGAASSQAATQFDIISTTTSNGSPLNGLAVNETVTVRLRITGGSGVFGLGASAWNYNEAVIDYVTGSGQSVASINHAVCIVGTGCFSGLANTLTNPLVETFIGSSGNRVLFFNGVGLTATNYNAQDPGLDGVVGGGGYEVELVFKAIANGASTIKFGTGYNGDGEVLAGGVTDQTANTSLAINVPEPASLAAGMAALASVAGVVAIRRRF